MPAKPRCSFLNVNVISEVQDVSDFTNDIRLSFSNGWKILDEIS